MNILFLANLIPYPLDNGGKIFTSSIIQALSRDNNIDLVCFYEHEDIIKGKDILGKYCSSIECLPIKVTTQENIPLIFAKALKSVFSNKPLAILKYTTSAMKSLIKNKLETRKYDCVFFNILTMFGYCDYIKSVNSQIKIVLYEQNCEALIYKRYYEQTTNYLKKIFLNIEINKLEKFEQRAINVVDSLILLSDEDRKELGISYEKCNIIPIGVRPNKYSKNYNTKKQNKLKLLFVGTMTWAPNNEGIIWFLENVMPLCNDKSKYELFIVGKNPSDKVKKLCEDYENVHLMGYVESLDDIYDKCDVLVVPLFIGSGQRVKIIEAFSRGYTVISTSIGAEGLKYEKDKTILIADDALQFKIQIDRCFNRNLLKTIGNNCKNIFNTEYSIDVITKKLNDAIQ